MPLEQEMIHPKGLRFVMQRKVVILRDVQKMKFADIAEKVRNRAGEIPSEQTVSNYYNSFSTRLGHVKTKYANCGRQSWKFTPEVEKWLVRKLKELRQICVCTSRTLQIAMARELRLKVSASRIRQVLKKHGFKWLTRSQKRFYNKLDREARLAFAKAVLRLTIRELYEKLALSIDGVVLTMPPSDEADRYNYCRFGEDHMWRTHSESVKAELAGDDPYGKQAKLARCIPLWGGCAAGGFGILAFHKTKKISQDEWLKALRSGAVKKAIQSTKPGKKTGPWHLLCDNEGFLESKEAKKLYKKVGIKLWHVPPRSPDLNPIEKVWAWLRRHLRRMDLKDAIAKRPVLGKTAYRERVRRVLKGKKAKNVASRCALSLRKTCRQVVKAHGQATRG